MTPRTFQRDSNGIPQVTADEEIDLWFGQGMAHATDRGLQMLLMRLVGQGRISEVLDAGEEMLRVDCHFRRANWSARIHVVLETLAPHEQSLLRAYCDGVNRVFAKRVPWEFKLCGYQPELWRPEDCVLLLRMMGHVTLASSQYEMERLLIEMVQAGVSEAKLEELFPGLLRGLDVGLIKQVQLGDRLVPVELWGLEALRLMASNNWVVAGPQDRVGKADSCERRSFGGKPSSVRLV